MTKRLHKVKMGIWILLPEKDTTKTAQKNWVAWRTKCVFEIHVLGSLKQDLRFSNLLNLFCAFFPPFVSFFHFDSLFLYIFQEFVIDITIKEYTMRMYNVYIVWHTLNEQRLRQEARAWREPLWLLHDYYVNQKTKKNDKTNQKEKKYIERKEVACGSQRTKQTAKRQRSLRVCIAFPSRLILN